MATATAEREMKTATADPRPPGVGEDGFPQREWVVNGETVFFSLKPYPESERPLYWNPVYPGQEMWWRSPVRNEQGMQPVVHKERWTDGKFSPRNEWEEFMTRDFLAKLPGGNPDRWKGENHPNGPGSFWRCQCMWICSNWHAFEDHKLHLKHNEKMR